MNRSAQTGMEHQASAKPSPPALSGPTATNEEKAEALFLKGKALFAEGKLEEAFSTYRAAFSFKKRSDIAGNLGNAAYNLGKMREAAEYLTYSIMNLPESASADTRTMLAERLIEARKSVGMLLVMIREKDCEVVMDGELLLTERTPEGRMAVFVEPGLHRIEVKRAGFKATQKEIQADAGSKQEVELEIPTIALNASPIRPAVRRAPSDVAQTAQGDTTRSTILIGGIAATAVGVTLGTVCAIVSNVKDDESDKYQGKDKTRFDDLQHQRVAFAGVSFYSFIGAGVVGAGTLIYGLVTRSEPKTAASTMIHVGPTGGAIMVKW